MRDIQKYIVVSLEASRSIVGVMVAIAFFAISAPNPNIVLANQPLPTMTVGYQSGKITAVNQTTFQIDGRTYSLTPDAVILDESGNQLDVSYIGAEIEAKFHVKKDQSDKIDNMILILPR